MTDIAIRVENLSKQYRIGPRERYKALRDTLTDAMYAPFRRLRSTFQRANVQRSNDSYIWALKDVSFEVKRGEVVGIIGRNGAGKTTLLKILSRITEPTEGYAEVRGRVGSLLEVGTGFHPELTGRENIYLNGAILGMKKAEIDRKFDEIVAFAEVEKFIDTPVKHYSSGMYVRLAFAVAAHLEPEILLVDEVLAVGDAAFQKKCLGKMGDVAKEGRTVLFVSHNMRAVEQLCSRAILLEQGRLTHQSQPEEVVRVYLQTSGVSDYGADLFVRDILRESPSVSAIPSEIARIVRVAMRDQDNNPTTVVEWRRPFHIKLDIITYQAGLDLNLAVCIKDSAGSCVFVSHSIDWGLHVHSTERGRYVVDCHISPNLLMPGEYLVDVWVGDRSWQTFDFLRNVLTFVVPYSSSALSPDDRRPGNIYLPLKWTLERGG